jgi:uncharacterized protein YprB with RNaseH-like and TPR domain
MARKHLTERLKRFAPHLSSNSIPEIEAKIPERYYTLAKKVKGQLVESHGGCYCLIKTVYPFGYEHGLQTLDKSPTDELVTTAAFDLKDEVFELPVGSMLFLDTETTGLGGSGAVAFLIGVGKLVKDGFEIAQYLIPDYSDEAAMLEDLYQILGNNSTIVTFNGASFDLPLLNDRFIINRIARKLDYYFHLDLLHPARRIYKRRLQDCTLTNLERQLFEFDREDDIPGYLVPSVYFDWVSSQDLSLMNSVLDHNRLDIISLYFLTRLISDSYRSNGGILEHVDDLHSLSRFFERRREINRIEHIYKKVEEFDSKVPSDAVLHFARAFKRTGEINTSVELWKSISESDSLESFWACVELSKHYEHREKDFDAALEYASRARRCREISVEQKKFA